MASKRALAKEWKRKKKQQQLIFKLSVIGFCILAIAGLFYIGWDVWSRSYVMTFNGERIRTAELRFFSAMVDWDDMFMDPMEESLEQLTQFLLLEHVAQHHGITLTDEERAEAEEHAQHMRDMFDMFGIPLADISDSRLADFMSVEMLADKLMDIYTGHFEIVDDAEFAENLAQFIEEFGDTFIEMEFRYHFSSEQAVSHSAWIEFNLAEPENIDEIILRDMRLAMGIDLAALGLDDDIEFDLDFDFDMEVPTIALSVLQEDPGIHDAIIEYLASLEVGDISEPIQISEDFFVIFIVDSVNKATDEEIAEVFRERYIWGNRVEMFNDVMESWREAVDIRINQRGLNAA